MTRPRRRPRPRPPRRVVLVVAAAVAVVDVLSKLIAVACTGQVRHLGPLTVAVTHNPGVAFGLLAAHPLAAALLDGVVTVVVASVALTARAGTAMIAGVVLGGAVGNLLDRLHGAPPWTVVDWIHLPGYAPAFNLADVAVRAGLLAWLISGVRPVRTAAPGWQDEPG